MKKFRVWDKEARRFIYPRRVCIDGSGVIFIDNEKEWIEVSDQGRFEIDWVTGLKDKGENGADIYGRDILGEPVMIDGEEVMSAIPVLWSDEDAAFMVDLSFVKDGSYLELLSHNYQGMAIIGNVHQHPELLTPKSK